MEALFVESKKQYAEKERFKDLHAQMRLGALMQKRYPLGVLGMENPSNPETIVYSDTHERWRHEADMHERTLTRMRENHKRHNRECEFGANSHDLKQLQLFTNSETGRKVRRAVSTHVSDKA